jgi:hypothetical protein
MFFIISRRSSVKKPAALFGVMAAIAVLSAASCSRVAGPRIEGTGSEMELRTRWVQWRAVGPESYSYELRRSCFCTVEAVTPARVEVRDGRVVAVRAIATGQPLSQPLSLVPTIDSLFVWAIAEAERDGHVEVAYDRRDGYPTRLVIGTLANDAGVAYEVTNLVGR